MSDIGSRIMELLGQKFNCAQIMMMIGLEQLEKEDPDAVRAMTGLGGGLGGCGKNCGALTGAICMLGLFAGRGTPDTQASPELKPMVEQLLAWFDDTYCDGTGELNCAYITDMSVEKQGLLCPKLIVNTCEQALEILDERGFLLL